MATRIIEYCSAGNHIHTLVPGPAIVEQAALTASGTSQQSAAFSARTNVVCIDTDEKIYVRFGENPTATTNSRTIPAGGSMDFHVVGGAGLKVAIRS
jgi:hypothetical protein